MQQLNEEEDKIRRLAIYAVLSMLSIKATNDKPSIYVSFKTGLSGVEIPAYLRERYPDEMTIVLQHHFYNLKVEKNNFSVILGFDDKSEKITVPWNAIIFFQDSYHKLQFTLSSPSPSNDQISEPERPRIARKYSNITFVDFNALKRT